MIQITDLHKKSFKCTSTRTGKISIEKIVFSDFIHVTTATSKVFATRKINFLISFFLLTYIYFVSSFVSGTFRRTVTYVKSLWNVPLQEPKYFLPETLIL